MENNNCIRIDANTKQINKCKQKIAELESPIVLMSSILNLAGNEVRLKILFLLSREKELCVCDLSDILSMKISAISQHLRKLKDRNLIRPNRKAQTIYYSLTTEYKKLFTQLLGLIETNKILNPV